MDDVLKTPLLPAQLKTLHDPKAHALHPGHVVKNGKAIDQAAADFEAMFLAQMLQPMWEGIETDTMFGGGHGEDAFKGMLINEYGKLAGKAGGLGIAEHVKAEMLRIQEKVSGGDNPGSST